MQKTKIEWCDSTWNPVHGCRNDCPYCYAREISKRFGKKFGVKSFRPTWIQSNFEKNPPVKPSRIFVNSMSDIEFWDQIWMKKVLSKIDLHPQHTFIFLTKFPRVYDRYHFPVNCWLGISATSNSDISNIYDALPKSFEYERKHDKNIKFISLEPLHEEIDCSIADFSFWDYFDWLIIGAETGNRKGKIVPEKEWIESLMGNTWALFMKDSLADIWGKRLIQEFPEPGNRGIPVSNRYFGNK